MKSDVHRLKMTEAKEALRELSVQYEATTPYQIKVGAYSFYPGRGTIYMDGAEKALAEKGLVEFIKVLGRLRSRNPDIVKSQKLKLDYDKWAAASQSAEAKGKD